MSDAAAERESAHVIVSERTRELSPEDLDAIQSFMPQALEDMDSATMPERLPELIAADTAQLFVGRNPEGRIVAAMVVNVYFGMSERRGRIDDVGVDPNWRRQGYASTLLDDALAWLRERGVEHVELESEPERQPAHALYRSRGFATYDTHVFELKF